MAGYTKNDKKYTAQTITGINLTCLTPTSIYYLKFNFFSSLLSTITSLFFNFSELILATI